MPMQSVETDFPCVAVVIPANSYAGREYEGLGGAEEVAGSEGRSHEATA